MILYSVTVNIDRAVHDEWLRWMIEKHVPDVLATGLFTEYKILRLLNEEENGGITYSFQYFTESLENLEEYQTTYASALQKEHTERYRDRFVAFRTVLEVVAPQ